jgi:two-component system chemotaxis sensor kinase CheA
MDSRLDAHVVEDELAAFAADPELAGMFITDALDHLGTIEATILKLEAAPADLSLINDVFRPFHTVKGNAGVIGITSIQEFAHAVETLLDLARSGKHPMGAAEIDLVLKTVDLLTLMVKELPARATGQPTTDVSARRRDLMARVEQLIAGGQTAVVEAAPAAPLAPVEDERPKATWDDGQSTVKVGTRKLDDLVEMVGELVIAQTILAEDPALVRLADERLARRLAHVQRITSTLQRDTMAMRMVPIRQTFQKMGRLLRDLSRKFGKPTALAVAGEETELDRKVVEHITDPLMHMVRNAIDHGIEPAAARIAAGKSDTAEIRLSAFHRAGSIVVEIADDGGGLDTDAILARAIAQGLVGENAQLSTSEICQLIFRPGFSTAREVTEFSGRGVGMDVVRRNIEALRGRIDIQTERGRGTVFSLQLPLTLAIVDGLLLQVGSDRFVIPAPAVQESLRPLPGQIHSIHGRPCMVQVRDRLIPLLHLGNAFDIAGARQEVSEATVVIAEDNGRRVALVVDELLGKQEVVIKSLGDMFRRVCGIAGGAILGDGRIGLILDTGGLLTLVERSAADAA